MQRRKHRNWVIGFVAFAGVVGAAIADDRVATFDARPTDPAKIDFNATLQCRLRAEPSSFNPILMFTAIDAQFEYLVWDRPFVLDENLRWAINPSVVEAFEFSDDHLRASLKLKPDLHWQDGAPFDANDIAFSWSRILDEQVLARKARHGTDQIVDCRAVNPREVEFKFKEALATNKWSVDFPIVPRHLYEPLASGDPSMQRSDTHVSLNRMPVGNGPYRVTEWSSGERITLERWEDYPGEKPAFAKIIFRVIPDNNAALLAFETGQIDEMSLAPRQFAMDTQSERFAQRGRKVSGEQWTNYYIGWNNRKEQAFLSDDRVRRALGWAVNGELINKQVFFGLFKASRGLFPESFVGDRGHRLERGFDLKKAGTLLDDVGWLVSDDDGWQYRRAPDGGDATKAQFILNLVAGSQTSPRVADILRADFQKLGVEMKTQTLEWSVFNERNMAHQFDAFLSAWTCGPDPDEARNLFHSSAVSGGRNYVGYENRAVDALFDRGARALDAGERAEIYGEIERIILDESPYTSLVEAPTLWAFGHKVRGVSLSPRGPMHSFPGVRNWWTPRSQ